MSSKCVEEGRLRSEGGGKKQWSRNAACGVWSRQNSTPILEDVRGILESARGLCVLECLAGNPHEGRYTMTTGDDIRGRGLDTGLKQDMKYRIVSKWKTLGSLKTSSPVGLPKLLNLDHESGCFVVWKSPGSENRAIKTGTHTPGVMYSRIMDPSEKDEQVSGTGRTEPKKEKINSP